MTDYRNLIIEPLNTAHDRADFFCGVEALDHYFQKLAGQDIRRRISRVFVAVPLDTPKTVIGYYSLSTLSIEVCQLPAGVTHKLPKYPVPAALLGRLAIRTDAQGNGIGTMLLVDAIKRVLSVSDQIAIYALVVDAIDGKAEGFYTPFGFTRLSDDSPRLFLPLKSVDG